jgi:clan AA aspartic protease
MEIIPKHIEDGKKVNLRMGGRGEIFITLEVLNEKEGLSEKVEFLIDTGFNGYLQLQESTISKLNLVIVNKTKTKGFDGVEKEVGVTTTKIRLLDQEITNFPIQVIRSGLSLIGTNLLKDIGQMLIIDYTTGFVSLTQDKKVQEEIKKAVDKYAK